MIWMANYIKKTILVLQSLWSMQLYSHKQSQMLEAKFNSILQGSLDSPKWDSRASSWPNTINAWAGPTIQI